VFIRFSRTFMDASVGLRKLRVFFGKLSSWRRHGSISSTGGFSGVSARTSWVPSVSSGLLSITMRQDGAMRSDPSSSVRTA
jgi:hypothetical protein